MRHVSAATFNGPLDLLLQLIEREEMDITQLSLAKITEEYIAELQALEELPMDELSDFLVVAAKLLLIKSRVMLPGDPVEDEVATDLERQLRMYKAFVDASKHIAKKYGSHHVSYPRDGWLNVEPIFNPPPGLSPTGLREIFSEILHELEPIVRLPQTVIIRTINIREKISQIRDLLIEQKSTSFHSLLGQANNKTEVIVTFLALLELVKQRSVTLDQTEPHGDVQVAALDLQPPEESITITSV